MHAPTKHSAAGGGSLTLVLRMGGWPGGGQVVIMLLFVIVVCARDDQCKSSDGQCNQTTANWQSAHHMKIEVIVY